MDGAEFQKANEAEKILMSNGGVTLKEMTPPDKWLVSAPRKKSEKRQAYLNPNVSRSFRVCMCCSPCFQEARPEDLYQTYYNNQKKNDIDLFFSTASIFSLYAIVVYVTENPPGAHVTASTIFGYTLLLMACLFNISMYVGLRVHRNSKVSQSVWTALSIVGCIVFNIPTLYQVLSYEPPNWSDSIVWVFVLIYTVYVLLPLRLLCCLVICVSVSLLHLSGTAYSLSSDSTFGYQVTANFFALVVVNILGAMSHMFIDNKHRTSFHETESHLKTKLQYEEHSEEQERLLLSVLPEHVADEIREDYDAVADGQFKKIYMRRHENVSILFADIVGFTAISSTYSASDLVRILNELFARFDKLAEKFHQLRIKILGDCYYCISGAPTERRDHAVLCVHMGLSMVEAIKYAREKTKSPVDMRVGIHTGGILAGIMGQRQWQFDVYSKDVVLANKMESGGRPGRVHISEKTLSFLNDEFEVEPGDGSSREEAIKSAGLKTYFIVKVLKPYPNGTLDEDSGTSQDVLEEQEAECNAKEDSNMIVDNKLSNEEEYNRRLKEELVDRGKQRFLYGMCNPLTLCFKDREIERGYNSQKEDPVGKATLSVFVVALFGLSAQFFVFIVSVYNLLTIATGVLLIALLTCVTYLPSFKQIEKYRSGCKGLFILGDYINGNFFWRHLWAVLLIAILTFTNVINMTFCHATVNDTNVVANEITRSHIENCLFPQYFTSFSVLVLLAITVLLHLSHLVKLALMAAITAAQAFMNILFLAAPFDISDYLYRKGAPDMLPRKYTMSVMMGCIAIALALINRHLEVSSRLLFRWKREAQEQKEKVTILRNKNEKLIYNILPHHVAEHFLGRRKQDEEMYSKSYSEVGVLFASMPNFSDFYTEESVNNQGLECLRFLNEVISDFDALLEEERFKDIIKIKTIGSTYMAASGLNNDEFPPDTPVKVRWAHLDRLTEFALALKDTLQSINEQSFNNFILRMGINHGPIIAGVIGVCKPHYDMWGNTVNVASRMESTGKASCIQVVEETSKILDEFGYHCELRGSVPVKGKGQLTTFYVTGKKTS